MILLLTLFPLLLLAQDGFGYAIGFGPGLSGKNFLIIAVLLLVAFRMIRESRFQLELPAVQWCFAILIGYATLTWWVASFIIDYERYEVVANAILLKISLLDHFLILLAFFYAPRKESEVVWLVKVLLAVVVFANVTTVSEWAGIFDTPIENSDPEARIGVLIAQVNQYALLVALFLPAMVAEGLRSRTVQRAFWYAAALLSLFCLVLTASRGGVVAILTGVSAVLFALRREVSAARVLSGAVVAVIVVVGTVAVLASTRYGEVLYERFVLESLQQGSAWDASSGRTGLWLAAIDRMAEQPLTFLTGYGWRVYFALGFWGAPHNTYLDFWFNLGLPGLLSLTGILGLSVVWVSRAGRRAGVTLRPRLYAALAGIVGVAAGLFFTEWYAPWLYFWAYLGLVLRMVVLSEPETIATVKDAPNTGNLGVDVRRDQFGWLKTR